MRLFITIALLFVLAVVSFADFPSKSESGCRPSRTDSALAADSPCLQPLDEESSLDLHQAVYGADHPAQQANIIFSHAGSAQQTMDEYIQTFEPVQARWLTTATNGAAGFGSLREKVGATLTIRSRLQARSEGALGQAPWYGMALGLTCTTLAAVMLG